MQPLQKGDKKLLNAWAFYDWANSVYSLVITSAIFPIYYSAIFKIRGNHFVDIFGYHFKDTAVISFVTAIAFVIVALISPILSGIADYVGNKMAFLRFFCYMGGIACMGLYWFDSDNFFLSFTIYLLGLIGFWGSLVFYNSYLPDIAYPEQQDAVSARGFSMGYLGSTLLLLVNLGMVMSADSNEKAIEMMRYSFVMTGIWWIAFSHITYYYLPKGVSTGHRVTRAVILDGFRELQLVWKELKKNLALKRYLASYFVFIMAVQTVMLVATYFGAEEITWKTDSQKTSGLIISILLIQLVAIIGAYLTSRASRKLGNIKVLIFLNAFWAILCIVAFYVKTPVQFYGTAGFVGLVMGGIQSLARSTYSKFLPETTDTASYFSFYDVTEKIGIVIGMSIYGIIDQITGTMRNSVLFLAVFFMIGLLLLLRIPKNKYSSI
ncbi:MFS transporter [Flavobacterium covae]|uniref:MFS transporter n=1 Tax=Flavobacterium covae TaxID=2906076 RepID=UPI000745DC60|nr:MFS transporter [Flavobacterium covae]AMA50662.1 MFS transporter permease [Flavobacterium covae]MCJ1809291.1 MFS transporter [Flavobacterium covae]